MNQKAATTFYFFSGFLLMTALFVLQPTIVPEVVSLQTEVKTQFSVAWQQTIGDQPYFNNIAAVFDGITAFYDQATDTTIALFTQPAADQDIYYVFSATYKIFANVLRHDQIKVTGGMNFMMEPAIDNIVPEDMNHVSRSTDQEPAVAGLVYQAWSNIQDASTGQIYCLAIYNGEVNKYPGSCKFDYH